MRYSCSSENSAPSSSHSASLLSVSLPKGFSTITRTQLQGARLGPRSSQASDRPLHTWWGGAVVASVWCGVGWGRGGAVERALQGAPRCSQASDRPLHTWKGPHARACVCFGERGGDRGTEAGWVQLVALPVCTSHVRPGSAGGTTAPAPFPPQAQPQTPPNPPHPTHPLVVGSSHPLHPPPPPNTLPTQSVPHLWLTPPPPHTLPTKVCLTSGYTYGGSAR